MIRKYIYGPGIDNPVAMIRRISTTDNGYYYYTDALGSVRLPTNASGAVVESYTYDPYGNPRVMRGSNGVGSGPDSNWLTEDTTTYTTSSLAIGNPIMFTGRWWDSTTKLYHYRARDYAPTLGRFLQPDPLGYIDGMNLYVYVSNNPLNWVDPWGLFSSLKHLTTGVIMKEMTGHVGTHELARQAALQSVPAEIGKLTFWKKVLVWLGLGTEVARNTIPPALPDSATGSGEYTNPSFENAEGTGTKNCE